MSGTDDTPDLGITEEDRRKMAAWADDHDPQRYANESGCHPEQGVLAATRAAVSDLRADGRTYVSARYVSRIIDERPSPVGKALRRMADEGTIDEVAGTGRYGGYTYRIDGAE